MNTHDKIRTAAGQISERGERVTVRAVREITGGDTSTITRVLKEMRGDEAQRTLMEGVEVPEALLNALKSVLRSERQSGVSSRDDELKGVMDEMETAIRKQEEAENRVAVLETEKAVLQTENGKLSATVERAAADLAVAHDAAKSANDKMLGAEIRVSRIEAAADVAARATAEQVAALKAQIDMLREESARARDAERLAQERAAVAEARLGNRA